MATVADIIEPALRKCGIRDTSDTTLIAQALAAFNQMIASWDEILHYAPTEESWTLTAGTASYTIGSGGDFDTTRPTKLVSAFIRDSGGADHPVGVNMTKEEYDEISDKDASARPTDLYYAPENTLGIIYFNTAPASAETFYLSSHKPYPAYSATTDTLLEPIEYEKALIYNLAVDLAEEYNVQLLSTVIKQSMLLKMSLMTRNTNRILSAQYDLALLRT